MSRVAAIDCGTNSIRLLVADATTADGSVALQDVHRETRIVRLGQGVDATGRLAPEALDRTRMALVDYAALLRQTATERVRMVATSPVVRRLAWRWPVRAGPDGWLVLPGAASTGLEWIR